MTTTPPPSNNPHLYRDFVDQMRNMIDQSMLLKPPVCEVSITLREANSSEVFVFQHTTDNPAADVIVFDQATGASRQEPVAAFDPLLKAFYGLPNYVAISEADIPPLQIVAGSYGNVDFKDRTFCHFQLAFADTKTEPRTRLSMVFVGVKDMTDVLMLKLAIGDNPFVRDSQRPFMTSLLYEWISR